MAWQQISVDVPADQVEPVSEVFNSNGALSVTVLDAGDEPLLEPAPGEAPLWSASRVTALFGAGQDNANIKQQLQVVLGGSVPELLVEPLADRDWSNTWRDSFGAMQFGKHLWVCPVGESPDATDAVVIHMDPGMAFGTGTHATTALCLEWLDAQPPINKSVIDYGCGSGILAIAACKLGASNVVAVDIDPQAVLSTRENARRNDCELKVHLPEASELPQAHLLLANILANPLIDLVETLSSQIFPGGQLVMTGILDEQAESVMAAYQGSFDFAPPRYREEWVLLEGQKRRR